MFIYALNFTKKYLKVSIARAASIVSILFFIIIGAMLVLTQSWTSCVFYLCVLLAVALPVFKVIQMLLATERTTRRRRAVSAPVSPVEPSIEESVTEFTECQSAAESTPLKRRPLRPSSYNLKALIES